MPLLPTDGHGRLITEGDRLCSLAFPGRMVEVTSIIHGHTDRSSHVMLTPRGWQPDEPGNLVVNFRVLRYSAWAKVGS